MALRCWIDHTMITPAHEPDAKKVAVCVCVCKMYIVVTVPRQDSMRLACANAVLSSMSTATICWKLLSKRHVHSCMYMFLNER